MSKIAIIGEAYGEQEEAEKAPFVGASGYELTRMLSEAGIHRADCYLTNVFNLRPPGNKLAAFCGPKPEGIRGLPPIGKDGYVKACYTAELERLADELVQLNPNLIIALGNTPLWALCGKTGISKLRGTTQLSNLVVAGFKVLPTYHPAAVLRQWEHRPIVVVDFMKAKREAEFPEIRRPKREIWIEPTLEDLNAFRQRYLTGAKRPLSVDIETAGNQITCIGWGFSNIALVVPFVDSRRKGRSYWATISDERKAWEFNKQLLEDHSIAKIFQNGLYDIAFLWRAYGIKVYGAEHDTMLLHHALHPESLKALGFLGSIYTDEGPWKNERKHTTTIKRDE